jgi:hypothetical protein
MRKRRRRREDEMEQEKERIGKEEKEGRKKEGRWNEKIREA